MSEYIITARNLNKWWGPFTSKKIAEDLVRRWSEDISVDFIVACGGYPNLVVETGIPHE